MDSRSRRLPFCLPSSRSSYTSSPRVSSSSVSSSRLPSQETLLNNDRFPRASLAYKADLDQQSPHLVGSSRDFSSSASRSTSWKLPSSLTSSSRSYDRPWTETSLSSRNKLTDSEGRLGMRSVLLNATDDGDSKRAKMSYINRGLYSRTPSTSVTGSTHSSNGLSSGRDTGERQSDTSSRSMCHLFSGSSSSSSKPLLSRRELETKAEPSRSGLREGRTRTGLTSSLYQPDRVTSTYAQGARPKETTYCPSSSSTYSSTARESSLNRHISSSTSQRSSLVRDYSNRTTARFLNTSSQEQTGNHQSSTDVYSSYPSHTQWYTTPPARAQTTLPPRPSPGGGEPEGHHSTRRLLSRLFSRRSSQDSSSGSSSVRSLDDDGPPTGGESVDSDTRGSEAAFGVLRNRRADLAPVRENNHDGYQSGLAQSRTSFCREPGVGRNDNTRNGVSSSSWLSSSLHGRCSPLLSRLRRHARNESTHTTPGLEEGYTRPQHLLRQRDTLDRNTSLDDEEEEDDKEENMGGAAGLEAFGEGQPCKLRNERLPDAAAEFSPRRRARVYDTVSGSMGPLSGIENQLDDQMEKPISSRDQEKLCRIKERLLLEDSDEEEGDLCRICQMGEESTSNPLIQPCRCMGSLQYVHQDCIKRWLCSKISSGTNLEAITTCELCKEKLRLNIDNFDVHALYRTHVQSEYDEFISSGLYLVVLLHFCEQRFSDVLGAVDAAGLFNLVRILHDHMDNLEIPHSESEEEIPDNRPSVEFSDLDDDLEEEY